jgi:hypothetical protein
MHDSQGKGKFPMISRKEASVFLAVILTTVAKSGNCEVPSGHLYAALMGRLSLDDYQGLIDIASNVGLVTVQSHVVTITSKGREIAEKINAATVRT